MTHDNNKNDLKNHTRPPCASYDLREDPPSFLHELGGLGRPFTQNILVNTGDLTSSSDPTLRSF